MNLDAVIDALFVAIKCLAFAAVGIVIGNAAVYVFNHVPRKWLVDYGKAVPDELNDPYTQRIKSYPWKYIFSMIFLACGIYLSGNDIKFAIACLPLFWLLVEISIADIKYRIIPDQFIVLVAITTIGFSNRQKIWPNCVIGAIIGFGVMALVAFIGWLIYRRDACGGGDIKLMAAIGLVTGIYGIIAIYIIATLLSAAHLIIKMIRGRYKKGAAIAFAPYATVATVIYMLFLWGKIESLLYFIGI